MVKRLFYSFKSDKYLAALAIIISIGAIVRLWGIEWGLPYRIGGDPGEFVRASLDLIARPSTYLNSIVGSRIYPPLYHYILTPFFASFLAVIFIKQLAITLSLHQSVAYMNIFVYENLWIFTLIARIVTALIGTSIIPVVYILANKIYNNKRIALISALIYTFLFGDVYFAHVNVSHILTVLLVAITFIFIYYLIDNPSIKTYVLIGMLCSFVISAKFLYWPIYIIFIIAHIFFVPGQRNIRRVFNKKLAVFIGVTALILIILIPPLVLSPKEVIMQALDYSRLFRSSQIGLTNFFGAYILDNRPKFNGVMLTNSFWGGMGVVPFILSALGVFYGFFTRKRGFLLSIFCLSMYLYIESYSLKGIKYLLPIFPLLTILGAKFLHDITRRLNLNNGITCLLVGAVIIFPAVKVIKYDKLISGRHTWVAARPWIEDHISPGRNIALSPYSPRLESYHHDLGYLKRNLPDRVDQFRRYFKAKGATGYNCFYLQTEEIDRVMRLQGDQILFKSENSETFVADYLILDSYTIDLVTYQDVVEDYPEKCQRWAEFLGYVNKHFNLVKSFVSGEGGFFGPSIYIYEIPKELILISHYEDWRFEAA